jgi:hypothetical protein
MAIAERVGMPLADFIAETNEQMFELINGKRIVRMPTVAGHNNRLDKTFMRLRVFADTHQLGYVLMEATFVLPDAHDSGWVTGSRTPYILFITRARMGKHTGRRTPIGKKNRT